MPPRIVRARHDSPFAVAALAGAIVCLPVGYVMGKRVFDPGRFAANQTTEAESESGPTTPVEPALADAGNRAASAPEPDAVAALDAGAPPPAEPRVPIRVARTLIQSCGDGEELNIPSARCEPVEGLEPLLRTHLRDLGSCATAEDAAAEPQHVLSIGLRVDFARRRITALPGRSSSLRNALTFVPCARAMFEHADEVFAVRSPHPRYLYFFSVYFGPLAPGSRPTTPSAHAPIETAPVVTVPLVPSGPTRPAAGTPAGTPGPAATPEATPTSTPTPTPAAGDTVTVVWNRVFIRAAPRDGEIIAHLPRGATLTVLGHQPGWFQVRWSGGTGWIFGDAIGHH